MANILGVGIATLDIINRVEAYPAEDAEVRTLSQVVRRGGNVTNTLVILSQLGHHCQWAGTLADDASSSAIHDDLTRHGVDTTQVQRIPGAHTPTSYITLNLQNGSRTIIHHRDLPEYSLTAFRQINLHRLEWVHFEGRDVDAVADMLRNARQRCPQLPLSVEIEKPREHIEQLCSLADLLIYSRHYALLQLGTETPTAPKAAAGIFLRRQRQLAPGAIHVCSWGEHGAYGLAPDGQLHHSTAFSPPKIIDTLGAGDTFNAGLIHARLLGQGLGESLQLACRLAGKKVGQSGFQGLTT